MPNAIVTGTGFYVPERVITNQALAEMYGMDTTDEWIHKRTGIRERRFAPDGMGGVEMALPASLDAIKQAGLQPHDIDMIVYCTLSPRHNFPGDGVHLQAALGLPEGENAKFVPALDVRNQCSGFLYGLGTATSMIEAGAYQHILLVGAECQSHGIDLTTRGRTVSSLFGDGAGAIVLSASDADRGVRGWWLGADGRHANALMHGIWDVRKEPFMEMDAEGNANIPADFLYPQMNGRLVFKNAVEKLIGVFMQACWDQKITIKDIDLVLFHQANLRINQYVAKQLDLPEEKVVNNIDRYGNTTAATIPILIAECVRDGRLKPGMKVALVAFGSGFTWGASIIDW